MRESDIQALIMLALSQDGCIVWRQNVGTGWVGQAQRTTTGRMILDNPRPLHAGLCVGSSDIIGIAPVVITPEMVGMTMGVFLAIECKTATGRVTQEQQRFIDAVNKAGGIAGVCRSVEDARSLICE